MPKRFNKRAGKSYAKRKGAPRKGARRLNGPGVSAGFSMGDFIKYGTAASGAIGTANTLYKGYQAGAKYLGKKKGGTRGRHGAAAVSMGDAASGAAGGFRAGKKKRMGTILAKRKKNILSVLADTRYPVIKDHSLAPSEQMDWPSGQQACYNYGVGHNTGDIQNMMTQSNSASSVSTAALITPVVGTQTNSRIDLYDKTTKFNFKNTCTHTVYLEIQAYNVKGHHSFSIRDSWAQAMLNDDMVQNAATFGTEQTYQSIGNRPDMRMAELSVRWKRQANATYKVALEPGQETSYTFVQPGRRFDQNRFNVQQGSPGTPVDVNYAQGFTSQILVFARSEMVADRNDNDVTYGSGHIAVNQEMWKSWSAVPYIKPIQQSFNYAWGTVVEADELDMNPNIVASQVYAEVV